MRVVFVLACVLASASACSDAPGRNPVAPSPGQGPLSGRWVADLPLETGGPGALELQLDERPVGGSSQLIGTWSARLRAESRSGTVSGTVIGGVVDVSLARTPRVECSPVMLPYAVLAGGFTVRASERAARLAGTVESWSCTGVTSGAIEFSR